MSNTLHQASREWATRPSDERFIDLPSMLTHFNRIRTLSRGSVVSSRQVKVAPDPNDQIKGLVISGPAGVAYAPTHWAFGQLATLAQAPAGYIRTLPAPIAADCLNFGMQFKRDIEDVGLLLQKGSQPRGGDAGIVSAPALRAATGPNYGRVWNSDLIKSLIERFGDGVTGAFRVPGEFGKAVQISNANTTLYASDRDCFVFLADEEHRIEVPNRRNGKNGSLARGFFVWNSEVGSATLGIMTFLFDYTCCNRIVWGVEGIKEIRIRHTSSAPDRFVDEVAPAIMSYSQGSTKSITDAIEAARKARMIGPDLDAFLAKRFTKTIASGIKTAFQIDEDRPIENLWDVTTGLTAYARKIDWQDERVALERQAGDLLTLASN